MDLSHDRLVPAAHGYTQAIPHAEDHRRSRVPSAFTVACMSHSTATRYLTGDASKRETMDERQPNAWICMDRLLTWRELGAGAAPAACSLGSVMLRRCASILTSDGTYRMAHSRGPIDSSSAVRVVQQLASFEGLRWL